MADTFETSDAEMRALVEGIGAARARSMFFTALVRGEQLVDDEGLIERALHNRAWLSAGERALKAVVELNVSCIVVTLRVSQTRGCVTRAPCIGACAPHVVTLRARPSHRSAR